MGCACEGPSQTQTSSVTLPQYITDFGQFTTGEAKNLYQNQQPGYYPDSTVVGMSPQTQMALSGIQDRALNGSPLETAAQQQTLNMATGNPMQDAYGQSTLMDTAQGNFLGGNPYYDQMVQQAINPVMANVQSQMSLSGRMGSGANTDILADSIGDITSRLAYQNYSQERQNQLAAANTLGQQFGQGLGYQQSAISALPQMAQMDYGNLNKLLGAGSMRETYDQRFLDDAVNRYNFEQQAPWDYLAKAGAIGSGSPYPSTTTSTSSSDPGFLGGAGAILGGIGNLAIANPWGIFG